MTLVYKHTNYEDSYLIGIPVSFLSPAAAQHAGKISGRI
jgi:hypothetical protein